MQYNGLCIWELRKESWVQTRLFPLSGQIYLLGLMEFWKKNMVVSEIATTCAHYGTEEFANGKFEKFKKPSVIIHWF